MMFRKLLIENEQKMLNLGAQLALNPQSGSIIYLQGELGAGKTTLTRGFLRALGYQGTVKSPTYTLVESYQFDALHVYHIDLYRLEKATAVHDIGLSDYLTKDSICLIEWPEKAEQLLPKADLRVCIQLLPQGREVCLIAENKASNILVKDL